SPPATLDLQAQTNTPDDRSAPMPPRSPKHTTYRQTHQYASLLLSLLCERARPKKSIRGSGHPWERACSRKVNPWERACSRKVAQRPANPNPAGRQVGLSLASKLPRDVSHKPGHREPLHLLSL